MKIALHCRFSGKVQRIGYRFFIKSVAYLYNIKGFVRNLSNGDIEFWLEGEKEKVMKCLEKIKQHPLAKIEKEKVEEEKVKNYESFDILPTI